MKTVLTITGIRPDFIRMSEIFKKLDENFNHILIHTGQHFDKLLSDVFFEELKIRKPDYNLEIGAIGRPHYEQQGILGVKIIELIEKENLSPDAIMFLGDSNSVLASIPLRKEYTDKIKIIHCEAGMRSGDKRMAEEINRICVDHCSDLLFVYHENYKNKLLKENIPIDNIYVVGNTIVEPLNIIKNKLINEDSYWLNPEKKYLTVDIHRPENFKHKERLEYIISLISKLSEKYKLPVKFLNFKRTLESINNFNIEIPKNIEIIPLLDYMGFIKLQLESKLIISDSGTSAEECPLLGVPVIVPRDFTERPESMENNNSFLYNLNSNIEYHYCINWINNWSEEKSYTTWLGDGTTSQKIIDVLKERI